MRYIFSRFKPFSGHSMDITAVSSEKKFRRSLEIIRLQVCSKKFWAQFHDWCTQKWSCLLLSSDAFCKFSPDEVYEESSWRIITIFASKHGAVCRNVETHFESSPLARFTKKFWAHFHDLCVWKRSCLQWNWDAFWKVSASKVYRESSLRIFTIFARQKEGVCFEVHTHFGSPLLVRFTEKVIGALSRFIPPKTKPFAAKFRRTSEVLRLQGLQKKVSWHS